MIPSGLAFSPFSAIDPSLAPALSATSFVCGDLKSLHQNLLRHICIKGGLLGQSLLATFLHHLLNSLHMRMHFLGSSLLCYTEVSQVCVADACWKYIHFPIYITPYGWHLQYMPLISDKIREFFFCCSLSKWRRVSLTLARPALQKDY
jgi:hypothetical protein